MNENDPQVYTLEILGQIFKIRTSEDPEYLEEAKKLIENKVNEFRGKNRLLETKEKALILVALNLAGEVLKAKQELLQDDSQYSEKLNNIMNKLKGALDDE